MGTQPMAFVHLALPSLILEVFSLNITYEETAKLI